ncbi:MAG: amidohydrolase family protein, partial [Christensenellales bacterium]
MESLSWTGSDVWYAHGIHFTDDELIRIAKSGSGVAHCPISNMKLASGVAKVPRMLELGIPVGLAVDGSASNDGSNLLEELRVGYLVPADKRGKSAKRIRHAENGDRGRRKAVGRGDIGSIAPGMAADMFLVDTRRAELVGAALDPKNMLATVGLKA